VAEKVVNAVVKKRFRDIKNKMKLYMPGKTFTGDEKRVAELKAKGILGSVKLSKNEVDDK
jgi:hypothetical protein